MKLKKLLALSLSAILVLQTPVSYAWSQDADSNNNYAGVVTQYSDVQHENPVNGYLRSSADDTAPVYVSDIATYSQLPSSFPEGDALQVVKNKYPGVRRQGSYGTCWAFSSLGLAEFDLINDGTADSSIDLSELQLAYFTYNSQTDPLGGTAGDYSKYYPENSMSGNYLNNGGNYGYASRRLSQWVGAVKESDVPYTSASSTINGGSLDSKYAYDYDVAHLQNAYKMSIRNNQEDVKKEIMEHGGVGIMYGHHYLGVDYLKSSYCDKSDTIVSYSDGTHAVMIVGWDDNYSRDNFVEGVRPQNDGAWLVRNSWGTESYDLPYFWMSYETYSIGDTVWAFDFSADDGYDNNYQYDGSLDTQKYTYYKTVANVFTVPDKQGQNVVSETLKAVSLSFSEETSVGYTIEVYTDVTDLKNPKSGNKQTAATTTGTTSYAGIYTIPLASEIELAPGSSYAVVLTTDKYAIDMENTMRDVKDFTSYTPVWDRVTNADNNRSLYYNGSNFGVWINNFCIKAFTSDNYSVNYELDGGINNSDNPSVYSQYTATELYEPTKDGYTFDGWYTDAAYTNRVTAIPKGQTGTYTVYAKWIKGLGDSIHSYSISLKGDIELNYYIDIPDRIADSQSAYVEFLDSDDNVVGRQQVGGAQHTDGSYVFSCTVAAKNMSDDISARLVDGDKTGGVYTYSVKRYVEYVLGHQSDYDNNVIGVAKALANYGAAAQKALDYNTDNLANSIQGMNDSDKILADVDFSQYKSSIANKNSVKGLSYYGSSLVLSADTVVRNYYTVADGYDIASYVFTVELADGTVREVTPTAVNIDGKNYYYIDVQNAKAYQLDMSVTVKAYNRGSDSGSGIILKYGAFSYAADVQKNYNNEQKLMDVTRAMYWYWNAASTYRKANQ